MLHLCKRSRPLLALALAAGLAGCSTTGEVAQRDQVSSNVGSFSSPPSGIERPRVAVPPFKTQTDILGYSVSGHELGEIAADQMTTLLLKTRRFRVIERAQLSQLLREQSLEGIVVDGELAQMGKVRGIDLMLLGKITNFRIKKERQDDGFSVGGRVADELLDGITGGFRNNKQRITTEVGVDIRLVDPESGEVLMAEFSEFERTDTAGGLGIRVAGIRAGGDAGTRISKDDAGQVLRLAFDDALQKAMPEVDRILLEAGRKNTVQTPSSQSPGAAKFCSNCGSKLSAGAKFCGGCGAAVGNTP